MTKPEEKKPQVLIMAQYVKDLSFENPNVPQIFEQIKEAPKIDLDLDVQVRSTSEDIYEVTLSIKVKASTESDALFVTELLELSPVDSKIQ